MKAKTKTYQKEISCYYFVVENSTKHFPNNVFHSFEKLLELLYVRKMKNNFLKISKILIFSYEAKNYFGVKKVTSCGNCPSLR